MWKKLFCNVWFCFRLVPSCWQGTPKSCLLSQVSVWVSGFLANRFTWLVKGFHDFWMNSLHNCSVPAHHAWYLPQEGGVEVQLSVFFCRWLSTSKSNQPSRWVKTVSVWSVCEQGFSYICFFFQSVCDQCVTSGSVICVSFCRWVWYSKSNATSRRRWVSQCVNSVWIVCE